MSPIDTSEKALEPHIESYLAGESYKQIGALLAELQKMKISLTDRTIQST